MIDSFIEILRLDANHDFTSAKSLLKIASNLMENSKHSYINNDGEIIPISRKRQAEIITHMIEVVDSLFIEPAKSVFITFLPDFAKKVADHQLWNNLTKLPVDLKTILNSALVLLCDI